MASFSERIGITTKNFLKYDEINKALSNRIWNLIGEKIYSNINSYDNNYYSDKLNNKFEEFIIVKFFKYTMYEYRENYGYPYRGIICYDFKKYIYENYNKLKWYEKYDLMEFIIKFFVDNRKDLKDDNILSTFVEDLNDILEEEKTAYRVIDYKITPITDKLELETVNDTLNNGDKFKTAFSHIEKALEALSQKPTGDYNKVIISSILALESALKESLDIKGNNKISNKELINKFLEKYKVNKFVIEPINKFIGILRNGEYDIIHSSFDDNKNSCIEATFMEAKYVLVMSCNFLNYIKSLQVKQR